MGRHSIYLKGHECMWLYYLYIVRDKSAVCYDKMTKCTQIFVVVVDFISGLSVKSDRDWQSVTRQFYIRKPENRSIFKHWFNLQLTDIYLGLVVKKHLSITTCSSLRGKPVTVFRFNNKIHRFFFLLKKWEKTLQWEKFLTFFQQKISAHFEIHCHLKF